MTTELTDRQMERKGQRLKEAGWKEGYLSRNIEDLCSFSDLLPLSGSGKFEQFSDYSPTDAGENFQKASEFFGGSGPVQASERVKVLKRIREVIEPLSLTWKFDYDVFPTLPANQSKISSQCELKDIYNHRSNLLQTEVFNKYPRLATDIPHVYALSGCFDQVPQGVKKVLIYSTHEEKRYQAQRNLLTSYVENKELTTKTLKQARRAGLKIDLYPEDPLLGIDIYLQTFLGQMFCRAILLERFNEAEEIAKLAVPTIDIMQTKEPERGSLKTANIHWQFTRDNFSQLQKEILFISGKRRSF